MKIEAKTFPADAELGTVAPMDDTREDTPDGVNSQLIARKCGRKKKGAVMRRPVARPMYPGRFGQITRQELAWTVARRLSGSEVAVYCYLLSWRVGRSSKLYGNAPCLKAMASELGMPYRTFRHSLDRLADLGFIVKSGGRGKVGICIASLSEVATSTEKEWQNSAT